MPDYIEPQIDDAADDPAAIADDMRDYLASRIIGWSVWASSPENYIIEAAAQEHAQTRRAATGAGQTFDRIARMFGVRTFQFPARDSTPAYGTTTWTAIDANGPYTIPTGTQLTVRAADGSRVGFEVTTDVRILAGQTSATGVQVVAVLDGVEGNGLSADARLEDEWPFITDVSMEAPTSGGSDGETDEEYLDRFTRSRRRGSDALITAPDFASFTRDFFGDGGRALVLPLYDASTGTPDVAGTFTVVPITPFGGPRTATEKADLRAAIEANLLTGITVGLLDPTYTSVTVSFSAQSWPPYDPAQVQSAAVQSVQTLLDPARWGMAPYGDEPTWLSEPVVRYNDVVAALENVDGLRHVTSLTVNGGTADVALAGIAGLPAIGPVNGNVIATTA